MSIAARIFSKSPNWMKTRSFDESFNRFLRYFYQYRLHEILKGILQHKYGKYLWIICVHISRWTFHDKILNHLYKLSNITKTFAFVSYPRKINPSPVSKIDFEYFKTIETKDASDARNCCDKDDSSFSVRSRGLF